MPAKTASSVLCPQCPWLISNHGRRSKGGFYRKDNLRRLWNQVRRGGRQQSCHLTDPSHPDHVAAGADPGAQPRECTGSLVLVTREIEKMRHMAMAANDGDEEIIPDIVESYLRENPKGLSKLGVQYWLIHRILLSGVPMIGGPPIPAIKQSLVQDAELIGRLPD